MKKTYPLVILLSLMSGLAFATIWPPINLLIETGAIKSWSSGETLHSSDLNSNFSHIHNTMVGGHGARLVDADVSPTASIALSKLAIGAQIFPKAWAQFTVDACTGANNCSENITTTGAASGVSVITHTALGTYIVTWTTPRADVYYGVWVTPANAGTARTCVTAAQTTAQVSVGCYNLLGAAASVDGPFQVLMMDNL